MTTNSANIDEKVYPEVRYYGEPRGGVWHHLVFKKPLPDGEPTLLPIGPSLKVNYHSSEFTWGYGGSGPAQLALALLLDATSEPQTALDFYQYFKDDKVSKWGDEWSITRGEILIWIAGERGKQILENISQS